MLNNKIIDGMASNNDNKQLNKQVMGLLGDTIMALILGVVGLTLLGGFVGMIWNLIA
jgi:hypothetical protein